MRIARAVSQITTLGPGKRLAIWVNGCSRGCPGCVSERLQVADEFTEVNIEDFLDGFFEKMPDGVTISGGEPFEQISELGHLMTYLRAKGVEDILIYTGYTLRELRDMQHPVVDHILALCSVLIDGPYVLGQDTGQGNLKGSDNQQVHFLDPSVKPKYLSFMNEKRSMQELDMGHIRLGVGIPDRAYIEQFKNTNQKGS